MAYVVLYVLIELFVVLTKHDAEKDAGGHS